MNDTATELRTIAYWPDGYFIADDDAAEQAEILDSAECFTGEHELLEVPVIADHDQMQKLVNEALQIAA